MNTLEDVSDEGIPLVRDTMITEDPASTTTDTGDPLNINTRSDNVVTGRPPGFRPSAEFFARQRARAAYLNLPTPPVSTHNTPIRTGLGIGMDINANTIRTGGTRVTDTTGINVEIPDNITTRLGISTNPATDVTYDHIMYNMLQIPPDSVTDRALQQNGIHSAYDLTSLEDFFIYEMKLYGEEQYGVIPETNLPAHHKSAIRLMRDFIKTKAHPKGGRLTVNDMLDITRDEWNIYRMTTSLPTLGDRLSQASGNSTGATPVTPGQYNPNPYNPYLTNATSTSGITIFEQRDIDNFLKGTKRTYTEYTVLKDLKNYYKWVQVFLAMIKTHQLYEVFDSTYEPTTIGMKELFKQKQAVAYIILHHVLQTDYGRRLVDKHRRTHDAQQIWKEFTAHAETSTRAKIYKNQLLRWICGIRYDSKWKGTSSSFVLYWTNKIQEYDSFCTSSSDHPFSDDQKLAMLQNCVNDHRELRHVRVSAEQQQVKDGKELTYDQYVTLLLSACDNYDASLYHENPITRQQSVFLTDSEMHVDSIDEYVIDDDMIGIDPFVVNVSKRRPPIQTQKQRVHNVNHSNDVDVTNRTYLKYSEWMSIPEAVREKLVRPFNNGNNTKQPNALRRTNNTIVSFDDTLNTTIDEHTECDIGNNYHHDTSHDDDNQLLAFATDRSPKASEKDFIRQVLSTSTSNNNTNPGIRKNTSSPSTVMSTVSSSSNFMGDISHGNASYNTHRSVNVTYTVNRRCIHHHDYSLIDRGCNGGVLGQDVRILEESDRTINITGVGNHMMENLKMCTGAGVTESQDGPIIVILHQYAYIGQGKTIHSAVQLEAFHNDINDKSVKVPGGMQRLKTPDGYIIPIDIIEGLPYIKLRPPTDHEFSTLPHVILTSDVFWDPTQLDHIIDRDNGEWYNRDDIELYDTIFDNMGSLIDRGTFSHYQLVINNVDKNYEDLKPYFLWAPLDIIKQTIANTTQYGRSLRLYGEMRHHYKSRFPAFNVQRRHEPVATDTVYFDTTNVDGGYRRAQLFVGRYSLVVDIFPMRTDSDFVATLQDIIRKRGAMDLLVSDRAQVEISGRVKDLLRALCIKDWQSEPYHQHQNFAERKYAEVKTKTNLVMNKSGAPANVALLCMQWVAYVLNHTTVRSLNWMTPMQVLTGSTSDISPMLQFFFWEPVFYSRINTSFPSESTEEKGHFVGISENVGDAMTFKVISDESGRVLYRSNVRSALEANNHNRRLMPDQSSIIIADRSEESEVTDTEYVKSTSTGMVDIDPSSLIGRSFLYSKNTSDDEDETVRMKIIQMIEEHRKNVDKQDKKLKFLIENDEGTIKEIVSYNEILSHLEKSELSNDVEDGYVRFKRIISHQGPLTRKSPFYKGSKYNLEIEWCDGDITFEPLNRIGEDDPVSVARYAKEQNLFDIPMFKQFKKFTEMNKVFRLKLQTAITCTSKRVMRMKYGYLIPNTHSEAMMLDVQNGNTKWKDAEDTELKVFEEYEVLRDMGPNFHPPPEYVKIRYHMVYDVKHDGRHRARLVAGGHLTPIPLDSIYSGVTSIRGIRIVTFISELNRLNLWGADVTAAYLEALTKEKVFFIAGPEFGNLAGHIMIVFKALYGLRSSGLRWHERLADVLRTMGFSPSRADPDIWIRRNNDVYEYIAVYVDDLLIAAKDPGSIVDDLKNKFNFQLKGVGPVEFHLGCDYLRNDDKSLSYGPKKYIKKMISNYKIMFGQEPKMATSPLEKNDHPEMDLSELLDEAGIKQYQSMIGAAQWAITLGRFDIHTAIMTMSQFRCAPRTGHLDRLKRIYGYLRRFPNGTIRINVNKPDFSTYQIMNHDWSTSVYGKVYEDIPLDIPTPLGQSVVLSHYTDANLFHDLITGRAVTGILHFINRTPIDWYSKRQATVETATYGAEFVAARVTVDQIIDLRTSLRYLGIPIDGKSFMFGDNNSVFISSTIPHSSLKKRHNALSYHRVREAIAAGIVQFLWLDGSCNFADILSKHYGHRQVWPLLQPLLFWFEWIGYSRSQNGECQTSDDNNEKKKANNG